MHTRRIVARGGKPMPGPFDDLVKAFEEWKSTLPQVKFKKNYWQPLHLMQKD